MSNIFNNLPAQASVNRNAFDTSYRSNLSLKVGQAIPAFVMETLPKDTHYIDVQAFMRSFPFNTASFTRSQFNLDFYHVKFSQLWSTYDNWISTKNDTLSTTFIDISKDTICPHFNLGNLLCSILPGYLAFEADKYLGVYNLNYVDSYINQSDQYVNGKRSFVLYLQYLEESFSPIDIHGFSKAHTLLRLLDLLGYGSYYSVFESIFAKFRTQFNIKSSTANDLFAINLSQFTSFVRNSSESILSEFGVINLAPWRLLAYNSVMWNYFRNDLKDSRITKNARRSFNVDELPCTSIVNSEYAYLLGLRLDSAGVLDDFSTLTISQISSIVSSLVQFSYIPWKRDMLTGSFNDGLYSNSSIGVPIYNIGSSAQVDPVAYRKVEALAKYSETLGRAGFKTTSALSSMYGSYDVLTNRPSYVGSFSSTLNLDSVEGTSSDNLGDLAAKGVSVLQGKQIKVDSSSFGVIVGILSVLPEASYNASGIHHNNTLLTRESYFNPLLDDLGFEPLTRSEFQVYQNNFIRPDDNQNTPDFGLALEYSNTIYGYLPRYYSYKTRLDEVHGEFQSGIHVAFPDEFTSTDYPQYVNGSLVHWDTPRFDIGNLQSVQYTSIYVNPAIMDTQFEVAADSSQKTDHFFGFLDYRVKSLRNMSVMGAIQF